MNRRMIELFGEVIYSYSRQQAIEDGTLIDVSEMAREVGIIFPVAITMGVKGLVTPSEQEQQLGQDYEGRLWDTLWMLRVAIQKNGNGQYIEYPIIYSRVTHKLKAVCGPGDAGEPVITIMLMEED